MSRKSESQEVATVEATPPAPLDVLGFEPFNPLDSVERPALPRIGISRETCQFLIGEEPAKTVSGHILAVTNVRAWWLEKFGTGSTGAPQCFAIGSTRPDPKCEAPQSESCFVCEHNRFARSFDDSRPGCNQKKRFLLLTDGKVLPSLLDIPALGLKACDRWLTDCAGKADVGPVLPLWLVRISLQRRQSKTSDNSGTEPVFELVSREDHRAAEIAAAIKAFAGQAKEEEVIDEEGLPF